MNLQNDPFEKIVAGEKTIELRLFDKKRSKLNIGDRIIFTNCTNTKEKAVVVIRALYRYSSFIVLFSEIPPEKCGYETGVKADLAALEMRKYYSEDQEQRYGVIGIKVEVIELAGAIL